MGVNATGTLQVACRSSDEDARIEAPQAARGCGLKIYEFFTSKWCDTVQMNMTATCGIQKFR